MFQEAARASERAASLLSDNRRRGQYGAVYPSPAAGDSEASEATREGEPSIDDAPPTWALYAHGEQAEEGDNDVNEHYASDASPRDAYRRQLAHIVQTTSPGTTFQLPTDVIDSQVRTRMPAMRAQGPSSASHAPSLLFTAPKPGDMLRSGPARTQDLAALPAMMMGRAERGGVQGTGVPVPTAVLGTSYEAVEDPAVAPLDSASGVVFVMGRSKAHALAAGGAVRLQSSSDNTHTTQLAMSSQAPFSLPAIKWVPPPVPLTEEQQEWETEKQALAAVDSAIPRIAKAGKMVQQVSLLSPLPSFLSLSIPLSPSLSFSVLSLSRSLAFSLPLPLPLPPSLSLARALSLCKCEVRGLSSRRWTSAPIPSFVFAQ